MPTMYRFEPKRLFSQAVALNALKRRLALTPSGLSLDRAPSEPLDALQGQALNATNISLRLHPDAPPVAAALGTEPQRFSGQLSLYQAFSKGVTLFRKMRENARGWEMTVDGAEALARGMVLSAAEDLLASGKLEAARGAKLSRWVEQIKEMEADQLAPEQQSRNLTNKLKAAAKDKAAQIEEQRQLLLTMAEIKEGKPVDLDRLTAAAQLHAQLSEEPPEKTRGQRR